MIVMSGGCIVKDFDRQSFLSLTDDEMISMGLRVLSEAPDFIPTGNKKGDTPVIRLDKLCFRRGKKHIFDDLSAEFYRRQITAITGRNGAGKTTLCKIIIGELRQRKGSVFFFGENTPAKRRVRDCFFVGQDADYQIFTPTVLQEVTLNTDCTEECNDVKEILESFDLWEYRKRHPASLSGGQKQRVVLAAALLRNAPFLILDEPTSGLDGKNMRIISDYLKRAAANGTCILVITHDKEFINTAADAVIEIAGNIA